MTKNSLVCQLMELNPLTWKSFLNEKHVITAEEGNLVICFYDDLGADFTDPLVQECRGIIVDQVTHDVVCWPFRKFGNYGEAYVDSIDWASARVQEKVDGSIVKLWYDHTKDIWRWSTNHVIDAKKAVLSSNTSVTTFEDLIKTSDGYQHIEWDKLKTDFTYIFELVGPENRVVIDYPIDDIYHTGTRNNITGQEMIVDIGVHKPHEYPLHTLEDCVKAAEALNPKGVLNHEGYVVVDKDWHRVKVKSPEYFAAHGIASGGMTKERVVRALKTNGYESLIEILPQYKYLFLYYMYRMSEFEDKVIGQEAYYARRVYEDMEHDRKASAALFKGRPLSAICFKAIDHPTWSSSQLASTLSEKAYMSFIKDYDPNN